MGADREFEEMWKARRAELVASHDDGAEDALREALSDGLGVECMSYCYGGTATLDVPDALADLAEAGWRLTRVAA